MDPDAAFALLKDQIESAQWQEAAETAENVLEWLARGGFPAKVTGSKVVDRIICESTCRAVAAWELCPWLSTHLTQEHPDAKVCNLEDAKAYLREHGFVEQANGWVCDEHALATLKDNEVISSKPI